MAEELSTRESRIEAALRECVDAGEAVSEAKSVVEAYCQMGRLVSAIKAGRAALAPLPKHCVGRSIPAGTESSWYALEDEQQRREFARHKYVEHSTYTGAGCAMCGKTESLHS